MWCCLHRPETEARACASTTSRTGFRHDWCLNGHGSIPVLTWKASPSPRVACCKGRDMGAHSIACPRMKDHQHPPPGAPMELPGLSLPRYSQWGPQGGKTTPLGAAAPQLHPPTHWQLVLVASPHYLVNLLVSLLADNFFQYFAVPFNKPGRQGQAHKP